ncbi:DsbA family protein [Roseicitreum antarcticum]|uniref:Protein-disulfide isomerase n=1 Tax=Roseicitreum antarcticum TaxID=564137 RepID=A0A1H2X9J4_9RHOB|nr:DsbA family protein [Roseicitreum antarcticum]SDW89124.1 Protein-disulfide isomerase [Roseicitreum antarcticum]
MLNKLIPTALGLAVVAGAAWYLAPAGSNQTALSPLVGVAEAQTADAEFDPSLVQEMSLGDADAPVTMIEYASFTCPHCANYHSNVFPTLKAEYVDTGMVRYVAREVYFDAYGLWAGMVARCGGEDRYFGIVDILYETQRSWAASNDGGEVAENLRRIGRQAGMSNDQINACLDDRDTALAMMGTYQENAERDNIRSTPSFMIDGELYSNMSLPEFREILDAKLEE